MRSMVAYGSFLDATRDLPEEQFKEVWLAILDYGIDGIEPEDLSPVAKMAFCLAKPNIDSNKKRRKQADDSSETTSANTEITIADNCEQLQTIADSIAHPSIDGDGDVDVNEDFNGEIDVDVDEELKPTETSSSKSSRKRSKPVEVEADVPAIPLNDGTEWRPSLAFYESLTETYPSVDIVQEFREMRTWSLANPKKKKTRRGVQGFVNTWLSKHQDRALRIPNGRASPYMDAIANRVAVVDSWV